MVREAPPKPDAGGEPVKRDKELDALMESMPPATALAIFMRDMAGMSESRQQRELTGASTQQRIREGNGEWPVREKSDLPEPKPSAYVAWLVSVKQEVARYERERAEQIWRAKERELERLRTEQTRNTIERKTA